MAVRGGVLSGAVEPLRVADLATLDTMFREEVPAMTWWQVLISWLLFQGQLGQLPAGGEADSPPFLITLNNGWRLEVNFHVRRLPQA